MIIRNVKIYTMDDDEHIIENGYVTVENGRITAVGEGAPACVGDDDIDGQGMSLYPGFIDKGKRDILKTYIAHTAKKYRK